MLIFMTRSGSTYSISGSTLGRIGDGLNGDGHNGRHYSEFHIDEIIKEPMVGGSFYAAVDGSHLATSVITDVIHI